MTRTTRKAGALALAGTIALAACGGNTNNASSGTTAKPSGTTAGTTPSGATTSGTTPASSQPPYAAGVSSAINTTLTENKIPGAILFIKSPKGDFRMTYGTAELGKQVPMKMEDYFRIGSNTKTMTVTVILQLVQEGKLKLDDKASKFQPDTPNGDKITIANLAEMRSGLFSYTLDEGFNEMLDRDPQKAWHPEDLLEIGFSKPVSFEPGEKYEYSNTNLVLLGMIIEEITGMSARDAFQQRLFDPLKLTHSQLPKANDYLLPDPHPQGYQFGNNVATIDSYAVPPADLPAALDGSLAPLNQTDASPSWAWTAGGATSTVDDLAVYVKAMVGGGLLDEKTQKIRMDSFRPINADNPSVQYGLGMASFGGSFYGHDGQIPGFSSVMVYDPKSDTTAILVVNLSAVPESGVNAAVVVFQAMMPALMGGGSAPTGDPAGGNSGTTAKSTGTTAYPTGTTSKSTGTTAAGTGTTAKSTGTTAKP